MQEKTFAIGIRIAKVLLVSGFLVLAIVLFSYEKNELKFLTTCSWQI